MLSPESVDFQQPGRGGGEDLRERPETPHQFLGEGLHVPAGNGAKEHQFEQLVIRYSVTAHFRESGPQPVPMAVIMGRVVRSAHAAGA